MTVLKSLFFCVDFVDPLCIVHLCVDLSLSAEVRVDASEVGGAPHLVGVELVGAPELVPVARARIVHAVEQRVPRLEAKLAIEVVTMSISHEVEAIVRQTHIYYLIYYITSRER